MGRRGCCPGPRPLGGPGTGDKNKIIIIIHIFDAFTHP